MLASTPSLAQQHSEHSRQALEAVDAYLRLDSSRRAKPSSSAAPAPAPTPKRFFTMLFSWGAL